MKHEGGSIMVQQFGCMWAGQDNLLALMEQWILNHRFLRKRSEHLSITWISNYNGSFDKTTIISIPEFKLFCIDEQVTDYSGTSNSNRQISLCRQCTFTKADDIFLLSPKKTKQNGGLKGKKGRMQIVRLENIVKCRRLSKRLQRRGKLIRVQSNWLRHGCVINPH